MTKPKIIGKRSISLRTIQLSRGALVTTHKIDLLKACRDLFDEFDYYAQLTGEISCISKRDGKLCGHAKDPISSGLALEAFLPENIGKIRAPRRWCLVQADQVSL